MILKIGWLFILNIIVKDVCSENILQKVISNPVISSNRKNLVVFGFSKTSSQDIFEKLLNAFIALEKQIQNNFIGESYELLVRFGEHYYIEFTDNAAFNETYFKTQCLESEKCFENSITEDANKFFSQFAPVKKPCPETVVKEFLLIISDICLPSLNIELNDINDCSMKYRNIALMLPTKDDVDRCQKEITVQSNELYIDIFSTELEGDIIKKYSDMNVMYFSTMANSKINFIVLSIEFLIYSFNFNFFPFELRKGPLCETGSIVGYFQYITPNVSSQRAAFLTAPLNYKNTSYLIKNYQNEIVKADEGQFECPNFINEFLISANSMPSNHEQYNIIVIMERFINCINVEFLWNNTNRHLEIIILYDKEIQNNYTKFITFPKNSLNHYTFYDPEYDGVENFWNDTTICESHIPVKQIDEAKTITSVNKQNIKNWILVGILLSITIIFITALIIARLIYIKLTSKNRMSFIREKAESISSTKKVPLHGKHWPLLLNDKDITINYQKRVGNGSKSNVYEALLTRTNAFHIISTQKVAAKISINFDDEKDSNIIMNELNSLITLKEHPNIIQLKGWTLTGSIPVIITELAEINLLQFVKNNQFNNFDTTKLYLQILHQISNALKYIAENKIIHRDIACRNILLLNESKIAKLADFGLSCEIKDSNNNGIYKENSLQKNRFPLKWLSIEALMDGIFSEKSDIWAFGVLCYEMFSYGNVPYEFISNHEMIQFLQSGNRLKKPLTAPESIYQLMINCWDQQPSNRFTFKQIHSKLEILLEYDYLPLLKKNKY